MDIAPSFQLNFFFLSAEIRWFIPGRIPREIMQWFLQSNHPLSPSGRTDTYLIFPHAVTSGVKFRENSFEIKSLVKNHGPMEFGHGIVGTMESWEKWSLGGKSIPKLMEDARRDESAWIEVKKKRILRTFGTESDEVTELDPVKEVQTPPEGCYAELTEVEIRNNLFWTIGLESFSHRKAHRTHLNRAADFLFNGDHTKNLQLGSFLHQKNSLAYPAFLQIRVM